MSDGSLKSFEVGYRPEAIANLDRSILSNIIGDSIEIHVRSIGDSIEIHMSDLTSDVSRPSALPTANLLRTPVHPLVDQNSAEFLDSIEEEWNKKVDAEVDILVDGMVDLVSLASVPLLFPLTLTCADAAFRSLTRTSSGSRKRDSRPSRAQSLWHAPPLHIRSLSNPSP